MLDALERSLVRLGPRGGRPAGTGFLFHRDAAGVYVLTCAHVVEAARKGGELTLDGRFEARVLVIDDVKRTDLAVLLSAAEELADRPLLELGAFDLIGKALTFSRAYIPHYQSFDGEAPQPVRVAYRLIGAKQLDLAAAAGSANLNVDQLIAENTDAARIIGGNSGSPLVEMDSRRVIGVIRRLMADEQAIEATAITELPEIWPDLPPGLIFHSDVETSATARLDLETDLFEKAKQLTAPVPLRILLAGSTPAASGENVNNERAAVKDQVIKAFLRSGLSARFTVELYDWLGAGQVEQLSAAGQPLPIQAPAPDFAQLDLVVLVAWHNLGAKTGPRPDLAWLYDQARTAALAHPDGLPALALFRRPGDELKLAIDDPQAEAKRRDYQQVDDFFRQVGADRYTYYTLKTFGAQFEQTLRVIAGRLIDRAVAHPPLTSAPGGEAAASAANPFRGLKQYRAEHAAVFFGRGTELDELIERLAAQPPGRRFLAVTGASGSGKSSLIRAGLFPRLQLDGLPGSRHWLCAEIELSEDPDNLFVEIADSLLACYPPDRRPDKKTLRAELRHKPDALAAIAADLLRERPADARLLLFIDQFEELFTLVDDAPRAAFIKFLRSAATAERLHLILTVRLDYYPRCLETELADLFKSGAYPLLPPDRAALLTMITRPVFFSGCTFEDNYLPIEILDDAGDSPGALPLMSYVLEQLFEKRAVVSRQLTRQAYLDLGRVAGVIQTQADLALAQVRAQVDVARSLRVVFRQLVGVDENGVAAKRPAYRSAFEADEAARRVIEALIERRILQSGVDDRNLPVVTIGHEAVLSHWAALRDWLTETRAALVTQHRVELAAREWATARQTATDDLARLAVDRRYLWRHERLLPVYEALDQLGLARGELEPVVRAFIREEYDRLVDELALAIDHKRRAEIGLRLDELGDQRPGVGLRADGAPDVVWCYVPGGQVTVIAAGAPVTRQVPPFYIAKYTITVAQFKEFADLKTYFKPDWWQGLSVKPDGYQPYRPEAYANHPIEWATWYEAVAFGRWLSARLNCEARLPTEWEWQQAACGGRAAYLYPWGETWDANCANTQAGTGNLVAVGLYPNGASPVGALDLSGNEYEWCANRFDLTGDESTWLALTGDAPRTTRGGAFFTFKGKIEESVMVTARLGDNPAGRRDDGRRIRVGIRVVCSDPPPGAAIENHFE